MSALSPVAEGLWHAEKEIAGGWRNGMFVLRLASGGLLVHSATRMGVPMLDAIAALGSVEVLFAPNHLHHLGLPAYRERFPGAVVVASDGARPRLAQKGHEPIASLASVSEKLPEGARFLVAEGTKNGEAFLSLLVEGRRTWIVCDALFHENRPLHGLRGAVIRLLQTAPGLSIGQTFRWLGLSDERRFRAWLERTLDDEKPERLLFSHGTPYEVGDGAELRALVARRLAG